MRRQERIEMETQRAAPALGCRTCAGYIRDGDVATARGLVIHASTVRPVSDILRAAVRI
jgi:hypothetical protein